MSGNEKDQNDNNLCNKHTTRCDKDQRAICPSKLSKSELEDLYFTLLDNNLQLKRTINTQNEKNRILSTKVQRMTAQTKMYGGATKDCCASAKAIINEQKATIADLKRSNEAMSERIRKLSTQLCTAKQFLKQNPNSRPCYKCYVNAAAKNQSSTSLHNKTSEVCTIIKSVAASAIFPNQDTPATTKTTETNTSVHEHEHDENRCCRKPKPRSPCSHQMRSPVCYSVSEAEKVCSENRCRSTMDDLKQKIVDLEEELAKTHTEYSGRMSQLETEVHVLQTSAVQARREHTTRTRDDVLGYARRLKDAAADKAALEAQLSFEKKRVVELGMLLKAAELSQKVAKAMESHLVTANRLEEKQLSHTSGDRCSYCSAFVSEPSPRPISMKASPMKRPVKLAVPVDPRSKDDSGYADVADCCRGTVSDTSTDKVNDWLKKRIAEMQDQLDNLKLASADTLNTGREAALCCRTSTPYAEKLFIEKECKYPIIVRKTPQVSSCCDPESIPTKGVSCNNETCENMTSDHDQNGCNSDTCTGDDGKRKLDDSSKEKECSNVNEEGHGLNMSKQSRERFSFSVSEQEVELKSNPTDKIVDEVSNTKSEQVPQEILECKKIDHESEEIKPETPCENVKDESNTTDNIHKTKPLTIKHDDHDENVKDESNTTDNIHITKPSTIKHDDHDSHQILGTLPVCSDSVSKKNKTGTSNWKKAKLHGKKKGINVVEDTNKIDEIAKTPVAKKEEFIGSTVKKLKNKKNNKSKKVDNSDSENLTRTYDVKNNKKNKDSVIQPKHLNQKRKHSRQEKENLDKVNEFATSNNAIYDDKRPKELVIEAGDCDICDNKTSQLDGNAKLQKIRKVDEFGSVLKYPPVGTSTPKAARSPSPPHTYTVDSKSSRVDSPDNTDNEISGMTDLPTEKDATTPRDILSPGEHKTTATSTESYSFRNDVTLSEGEVPASKYSIRRMSKSMGEVRSMDDAKEDHSIGERRSSADKMEEALQAISQELARCRSLLQRPRPSEQRQRIDVATSFERHRDSIILQKTKAKRNAETSCLFMLHISTILLNDEVVAKSDGHLMLTWKFLNLSTVTHMSIGSVIDVGFTARYKIEVNKNSLDYFRNEDMPIVISEDGVEEKALATCTLPLQRVLAQANRRVDLTLPLRAGPCMNEKTSKTNSSDDVGVVDLWCMLSCDSRHLASINDITQNTGDEPTQLQTAVEETAARSKSEPELNASRIPT